MRCGRKRHPFATDVHAPESRYDRRDGHNDRDRCQIFHYIIQAIVDDRRHQFSGTIDDITIDLCHLDRLSVLNDHIL